MVGIGNTFFYTRSLPCTLWCFDCNKEQDKKQKDRVLMLDARNIYRDVTSRVNDFNPGQLQNLILLSKPLSWQYKEIFGYNKKGISKHLLNYPGKLPKPPRIAKAMEVKGFSEMNINNMLAFYKNIPNFQFCNCQSQIGNRSYFVTTRGEMGRFNILATARRKIGQCSNSSSVTTPG